MRPSEFLRAVLPSEGYVAIVGIKNKKVQQVLVDDVAAAKGVIGAAIANEEDVYFGCATYQTPDNRKKDNVQHVKAFWVDLDCGDGTAYPTHQDGWDALYQLCVNTGLPTPFVVNSGGGLHVYWVLESPIAVAVWSAYATKLVELCAAAGLSIKDPGCSTDPARILRVPNTKNYKLEEPRDVELLCEGAVTPWDTLKGMIEKACGARGINGFEHKTKPVKAKKQVDATTAALSGNQISIFKKVAKLSLEGKGCAQVQFALENPADTSEPLWRAMLSIAEVCEDRNTAIHKISRGHPGYDPADTERKASETNGPHTCAAIESKCGSALCAKCPLKGKIVGPIALGKDIARAEPKVDKLSFMNEDGQVEESALDSSIIKIPDMPFPYFRGKHGGIYMPGVSPIEGEEGEPVLVYEHDLNVVRRIKDPEKGEVLIVLHNRPKDGVEEIVIPLADAQSIERMKDKLGYHGVAAHKEQMNKIGTYMTRAVKNMQHESAAEPARSQMGWTEDRKGIVWGRTMFTAEGQQYCPPASKSTTVANMMKTSGTFEAWEDIASRYAAPGFELYAACILAAFGSMLNAYTYEDPVWLHMVSSESGTGKTTLTNVINSIWGDPLAMKLTVKDTINALEKRRVVFNSMAICQDEITNLSPERLSDLAYAQSQGREKLRLNSGSQEISNNDRRNNTLITNGNKHISDVLGAHKTNAAGEYARLVEVVFAPLETRMSGEDHFGKILKNYGHAGPMFAKWLVAHEKELDKRVAEARAQFEHDFESVSSERNWVALAATMFAAGKIIQEELGLLKSYDLPRIYQAWLLRMGSVRKSTAENLVSHDNVLGDFISDNWANILMPDPNVAATAAASPQTASLYGARVEREARGKLIIRYEKDTDTLFIAQNALKDYCVKRSHSYVDLLSYYSKNQQFLGVVTKRMGAGTPVVTSPIKALAFHAVGALGEAVKGVGDGNP